MKTKVENIFYTQLASAMIKRKRLMLNIQQGDFSKLMGLSQATYSRLETGAHKYSFDQVIKATEILEYDGFFPDMGLYETVISIKYCKVIPLTKKIKSTYHVNEIIVMIDLYEESRAKRVTNEHCN